jgi:hypothetical protein
MTTLSGIITPTNIVTATSTTTLTNKTISLSGNTITGTLPVANGGTGLTSGSPAGAIIYTALNFGGF